MMNDSISRAEALKRLESYRDDDVVDIEEVISSIGFMPSAQPERTEYIPDTKAVRSKRNCVDLAERVTATFYDQEHEEWTQQTVTIADVLDSVCDEYTILPSVHPERKKGKWKLLSIMHSTPPTYVYRCSECGMETFGTHDFCPNCGAEMER